MGIRRAAKGLSVLRVVGTELADSNSNHTGPRTPSGRRLEENVCRAGIRATTSEKSGMRPSGEPNGSPNRIDYKHVYAKKSETDL